VATGESADTCSLASEVAKARQHIKTSLECVSSAFILVVLRHSNLHVFIFFFITNDVVILNKVTKLGQLVSYFI
jgi:hypothetical protein